MPCSSIYSTNLRTKNNEWGQKLRLLLLWNIQRQVSPLYTLTTIKTALLLLCLCVDQQGVRLSAPSIIGSGWSNKELEVERDSNEKDDTICIHRTLNKRRHKEKIYAETIYLLMMAWSCLPFGSFFFQLCCCCSFYFNKTLDPRPLQTYFRKPGTWTLGK